MAYKALVIDDDKVTLELLSFQLQSEGFETVAAETGERDSSMCGKLSLTLFSRT